MWALLTAARKAYKSWKSLDPPHRAALNTEARRVRALVAELGGPRAERFLDGSADVVASETEAVPSRRSKEAIAAELREAVEALSQACVAPGAQIVSQSTPAPLRLGARMVKAGARRTAPRLQRLLPTGAQELPQPAAPPADWYDDPFDRFTQRWWDGERWTEDVARDGVPAVDPPVADTVPATKQTHPDSA